MTTLDRCLVWWLRPSRAQRIESLLARIANQQLVHTLTLHDLRRQGDRMAVDVAGLEGAAGRIEAAVQRAASELRDLASKLLAPDGAEQIAAVAGRLNSAADALNAVVSEVDADGSSPAV